jgi:hypothetical protein
MITHSMTFIDLAKLVDVNLDGEHQLWDVYLDGQWLGSRRTIDQCKVLVAQTEERLSSKEDVAGSNPAESANKTT